MRWPVEAKHEFSISIFHSFSIHIYSRVLTSSLSPDTLAHSDGKETLLSQLAADELQKQRKEIDESKWRRQWLWHVEVRHLQLINHLPEHRPTGDHLSSKLSNFNDVPPWRIASCWTSLQSFPRSSAPTADRRTVNEGEKNSERTHPVCCYYYFYYWSFISEFLCCPLLISLDDMSAACRPLPSSRALSVWWNMASLRRLTIKELHIFFQYNYVSPFSMPLSIRTNRLAHYLYFIHADSQHQALN